MQPETISKCPQCKEIISDLSKRLIKDTCGHEKCRICLLQEDDGCRQCKIAENNYTTVIKHSNTQVESQKILEEDDKVTNSKLKRTRRRKIANHSNDKIPEHIVCEEGETLNFKCTICNSKFRTKRHINYHEFCVNNNKPFKCKICSKSYVLKSQLNLHELVHSNSKPHLCKICNKSFRESGKLKRHVILLHSSEKPHVCDECGKSFKIITSLKQHRLIHLADKPFSCNLCEMKFNNSSNMKKHLLTHSDLKSHMCEQCGKKFKDKSALNVHKRIHLHIREFICEICDKAFVNLKDLKRHQLIHSDSKTYSCGLCFISFRRKDNLGRHIKNAHPNKKAKIIENETDNNNSKPVDNPNAINVITVAVKSSENKPRMSMNGPLKLAFKTSAFKKNYNITSRDVNEEDSTLKVDKTESTSKIFPSVYSTPNLSVEDFYADQPKFIENIKFRIPENLPVKDEGLLKTLVPQTYNNLNNNDRVAESKNIHTSVIVNSNDQKNVHWRRRMTQNVESQH